MTNGIVTCPECRAAFDATAGHCTACQWTNVLSDRARNLRNGETEVDGIAIVNGTVTCPDCGRINNADWDECDGCGWKNPVAGKVRALNGM